MCGYVNDYENDDNMDWIRGTITSSGFTGPSIDHTLQTGYGEVIRMVLNICRYDQILTPTTIVCNFN